MAAVMAVFRSCMESFKSILTSPEFGSDYELLCTELSTQWLRIRLWGESVGLHINDAGQLQSSLSHRADIESTITQCVSGIAYLLTEIEVLRRKYELRTLLLPNNKEDDKSTRACKTLSTLSDLRRPASLMRHRMKSNQKEASFLAITKWTLCDAKRFDDKVKRLKSLVDGLEDISQAAGIAQSSQGRRSSSLLTTPRPAERPPPYSLAAPAAQQAPEPITPSTTDPVTSDPHIMIHHLALRRFIGLYSSKPTVASSYNARPRLMGLCNRQFQELRVDVYDDMMRRRHDTTTLSLPIINHYHEKRNQARQKLSNLSLRRFQDLTTDVVFELERRFTCLQLEDINESERPAHVSTMSTSSRRHSTRRYGRVEPHTPPPRLRERPSHPSSLSRPLGPDTPAPIVITTLLKPTKLVKFPPTSRYSSSAPTTRTLSEPAMAKADHTPPLSLSNSRGSAEIFKSFRVSMQDPTSRVLPAALKKYNINADATSYALYICHGDKERCLGSDEKPLVLFKQLDREGLKPMFMLRKIATNSSTVTTGDI